MYFYFSWYPSLPLRNGQSWDFPGKVQWLGLGILTEGAPSLIPGGGLRSNKPHSMAKKKREREKKWSEGFEPLKAEILSLKIN